MAYKFRVHRLSVRSALANYPCRPPFRVFQAITAEAIRTKIPLFSLPSTVSRLLGSWEVATALVQPRIWAPRWNSSQLTQFISDPYQKANWEWAGPPTGNLRVAQFLERRGVFDPRDRRPAPWTIVHFAGQVGLSSSGHQPFLIPDDPLENWPLTPGALRDQLVASGTRLFILQCLDVDLPEADRLAKWVVAAGGPAVLVVAGDDDRTIQDYFFQLYANIVHNRPLSEAANVGAQLADPALDVDLYLGTDAEESLRLDGWMLALRLSLYEDYHDTRNVINIIEESRGQLAKYVHRRQLLQTERTHRETVEEYRNLLRRLESAQNILAAVPQQPWHQEREGAVPVAEATAIYDLASPVKLVSGFLPRPKIFGPGAKGEPELSHGSGVYFRLPTSRIPRANSYEGWVREVDLEAERAPRVLNSGFRDADSHEVLEPDIALLAGHECELLVDVGPRWNRIRSLVTGQADFPEYALESGKEGYEIEVLFVSEDFDPRVTTARLWLPQGAGRSFPIVGKQRALEPGPVALRLTAPKLKQNANRIRLARGRLSLYYRGNLLQSATVRTAVGLLGNVRLERPNTVDVDFVLTSSFQELDSRFGLRTLNLTLNDDGAGGHRIVAMPGTKSIPALETTPPGWIPYNPAASGQTLEKSRAALVNCFREIKSNNGKSKEQFLFDLRALALLGRDLFNIITSHVNVEGDVMKAREWSQSLRKMLTHSSIVQVARAGPAEYVFPWALVYDLPLPGPDFKFCQVTDEWDSDGLRHSQEEGTTCPYAERQDHEENILCPYGFWGLKHIIEQPPSVLKKKDDQWVLAEATNQILFLNDIQLSIGITRDPQLNRGLIDDHIEKLTKILPFRLSRSGPADDVATIRSVLEAPAIAYFLCHGKYDPVDKSCYLGIGHPDDKYHQILPGMVQDWADTAQTPNLAAWPKIHPFVFINGCHTSSLKPEETLQFVSAFTYAEASGVLGTEISVQLPVAAEVGQLILNGLAGGSQVGELLYDVRWKLVNKGSMLGLAYTLYAMSDLRLAHNTSAPTLPG